MSATTLIQLLAACVGIVGSLFFAVGVMRQSVEAMGRLAGSHWDWNPHMPPALAAQKADYLFGGGLIVLAFVLQLASFFVPAEANALSPAQAASAPWVAAFVTVGAFFLLRFAAGKLAKYYETQISEWLEQRNAPPQEGT